MTATRPPTIGQLAARAGVSYSAMWKRLHPDRVREWSRRDNARRPDRDRADYGVCPKCGGRKAADRKAAVCRSCDNQNRAEAHAEHRTLVEGLWAEGKSCKEISRALGIKAFTPGAYRRHGYDLPYRYGTRQVP